MSLEAARIRAARIRLMRTVKAVVVACLDCAIAERGIILSRKTRAELANWLVVCYIGRKPTEFVCDIKFGD